MPKLLVLGHGQSQLRFFYLGQETVETGQAPTPPTGNTKMLEALAARLPGWSIVGASHGASDTQFLDNWVVPETAGDAGFTVNAVAFLDLVASTLAAHPDATHVVVNHFVQTQDWKDNLANAAFAGRYLAAMKKWEAKLATLIGARPWVWGYCHIGNRNMSVDADNITDARRLMNAVAGIEPHPLVTPADRISRFRILAMPGIWRASRGSANAADNDPAGTAGDFTHQGVATSRRIAKEIAQEIARWAGGTIESTRGHPHCVGAWRTSSTSFRARFFITPGAVLKNETALRFPVQVTSQPIGNNAGETLSPTLLEPTALSIDNSRAAQGIAEITCTMADALANPSYLHFGAAIPDYVRVGEAGTSAADRRLPLLFEDASPGAALTVAADFADIASPFVPLPVADLHNLPIRDGDPAVTALSNYAETLAMNALMTGTRHVALGSASSDTSFTEFSGGSYARASGTFAVAGNQASNAATLVFPAPTADWGQATHIAVFDAATGGNLLWHGPLAAPLAIAAGASAPQIAASQLVLSLD
jgi:hypothetical protein